MWVTKLLISPVKKGFFAQKQPNLAQIGISEHCWLIWCPVDGLAGGARAVSRKTPIYFIGIQRFICNLYADLKKYKQLYVSSLLFPELTIRAN